MEHLGTEYFLATWFQLHLGWWAPMIFWGDGLKDVETTNQLYGYMICGWFSESLYSDSFKLYVGWFWDIRKCKKGHLSICWYTGLRFCVKTTNHAIVSNISGWCTRQGPRGQRLGWMSMRDDRTWPAWRVAAWAFLARPIQRGDFDISWISCSDTEYIKYIYICIYIYTYT